MHRDTFGLIAVAVVIVVSVALAQLLPGHPVFMYSSVLVVIVTAYIFFRYEPSRGDGKYMVAIILAMFCFAAGNSLINYRNEREKARELHSECYAELHSSRPSSAPVRRICSIVFDWNIDLYGPEGIIPDAVE